MSEKEVIFSSSIKFNGIFSFKDFYKFCYDWLAEELELDVTETKYGEKIAGNTKEIDVAWEGERKLTDYFKFQIKTEFMVRNLTDVEATQSGVKVTSNKGSVQVKVKGTLIRDYDGKFETTAFKKFLRSIYEKWIIASRIEQFEEKLASDCDEFLAQGKAYLDLEGKR